MRVSKRVANTTDSELRYARQLGVRHIIGYIRDPDGGMEWEFGSLLELKKRVESFDLNLAAIGSPPASLMHSIVLGDDKHRDATRRLCECITNMGRVGIPVLCYDFSVTQTWGRWRQGLSGGGRGGAGLMSYDHDLVKNAPPTEAGTVRARQLWERLERFLKEVLPVAEGEGVGLACHPDDPPVPELRGAARILTSVEGLRRLLSISDSLANGLLLCQGTIAEMGEDVLDAIRTLGPRTFVVHFRNIRRHCSDPLRFDEVFINEGDVDMAAALRTFAEIGYEGLLDPDHAPVLEGDSQWGRERGLAYAYGYLAALMEQLPAEARR